MESLSILIQVKAASVQMSMQSQKMLRPEKIHGECMTAQASYTPFQCIDILTGELFASTKDQCQVKVNQVRGVLICRLLRVNHFMLMARLSQYWLMDFYL
jgi:hypothetical protein